jgi:acetyl esterase/lipase
MGAVTALLHGDRDPSIAGMVLDSPFSDLKQLVNELARTHTKVPSFLVSTAMALIRKSVQSRAEFDIYNLKPI